MTDSETIFRSIYERLDIIGKEVSPRGLKILEVENFNYVLPPFVRFVNFESRKLNLKYIKREFLWYLTGNKFDVSITDHAKIWKDMVNKDNSINSNYGQYIFGDCKQFDNVIRILREDKDSRRASIVILSKEHLLSNDLDLPCTYSINFRIRENYLNMSVRMRSQDSAYGMGNDAPAFSFIHEMMLNALKEFYPELQYGDYYHSVDSFHIYEKHFKMLDKIINNDTYKEINCPKISGPGEVKFLKALDFINIPTKYKFSIWLTKGLI